MFVKLKSSTIYHLAVCSTRLVAAYCNCHSIRAEDIDSSNQIDLADKPFPDCQGCRRCFPIRKRTQNDR